MRPEWQAPEGAVWVCGACGKYGKARDRVGDEACFMKAVLCEEGSLVIDPETGCVRKAKGVEP